MKNRDNKRKTAKRRPSYLRDIDRQTREQVDRTVALLMKRNGVNEVLKARDQMAWVRAMNPPLFRALPALSRR